MVPDSCIQCHGSVRTRGKANDLDTDHWLDRVTPQYGLHEARFQQEEFTALVGSPHGVLYDGRKDQSTEKFGAAFDVIQTLNSEITNQNRRVGAVNNFQLGAVRRWLELHEPNNFGSQHMPPYQRGYSNLPWKADDENHRKLLYFLNRYYYRCHSSVRYNVFDREAVVSRKPGIRERILNFDDSAFWMPQDRIFPGLKVNATTGEAEATSDLAEFLGLLEPLQPE